MGRNPPSSLFLSMIEFQRCFLGAAKALPIWDRLELPTWLLIVVVYSAWGLLMMNGSTLPWWLFCPLGAVIVAWQGSLQHELLHGHPTRSRLINSIFAWPPLDLWMPYHVYRESHLEHHRIEVLSEPVQDPESYYFLRQDWDGLCPVRRSLLRVNNCMLGRAIFGPMIGIIRFLLSELRLMGQGNFSHLPGWGFHIALSAVMLFGLQHYLGIPAWLYAIGIAYPSTSFIMMRSFLEHRPSDTPGHRTVIVEGGWFWRWLFLNNNLHVCHHNAPGVAWYKLPAVYRENRDAILESNGGYLFRSYGEIARNYLIKPKDMPVYPG